MKILVGPNAQDTRVLLDDGRDITSELEISSLLISVDAGEDTRVEMNCYAKEVVVLDLLPGCITASTGEIWKTDVTPSYDYSKPPPPQDLQELGVKSPEAILDTFKV